MCVGWHSPLQCINSEAIGWRSTAISQYDIIVLFVLLRGNKNGLYGKVLSNNIFNWYRIYLDYAKDIISEVRRRVAEGENMESTEEPAPLCDQYARPEKEEAIASHKSRFTK